MDHIHDNALPHLLRWNTGDDSALAELLNLSYAELLTRAKRQLYKFERLMLEPEELVSETYPRLTRRIERNFTQLADFYNYVESEMHKTLLDKVKHQGRDKRGGQVTEYSIEAIQARFNDDD